MRKPFRNNRKVRKAKQLLAQALREAQSGIRAVRRADPRQAKSYQRAMAQIGALRGRPLFFPYIGSGVGKGALVELADGSVKLDFITGIGVHYMGHSHLAILESCVDAALEDIVMQGNLQLNAVSGEAAARLAQVARLRGNALKHCFLTSSGAMANENALKIIFQKKFPAVRLLAFEKCFAGRTLAVGRVTDRPEYRQGMPKTIAVDHIPFFDPQKPRESTKTAVRRLKQLLGQHKGQYAGMCFELIQGEGGTHPGSRGFFTALMEVLKRNRVAVMVDEIQTFGRTTYPFAFQHFGLGKYVDVVTVGKMAQFCATLFTAEYNPKAGLLSQTFTASSSALHAGNRILKEVMRGGYFGKTGRIAGYERRFHARLAKLARDYPGEVAGPFGLGAMAGFTYAGGSAAESGKLVKKLYDNGLMSFTAGKNPTRVRFLMPVGAVTARDIDAACAILRKTILALREPGAPGSSKPARILKR